MYQTEYVTDRLLSSNFQRVFKSSAVYLKANLYSVFFLHKDCFSVLVSPIIKRSAIESICAA